MSEERTMQRWRGLAALVRTAVDEGSRAIERVHLDTARRPFAILEQVPLVAAPSKLVHVVHDAIVTTTYTGIRLVNGAVGKAAEVVIDQLDDAPPVSREPLER
jgi:hypothetical protein